MREEKKIVQEFYDHFGWQQAADGNYEDTNAWIDLRPVMLPYYRHARRRAHRFFSSQGTYFLDAGSGAVPHPEYAEYSTGYKWHVCVDLSEVGLRQAQKKLQNRGAYVVADVTRLPFRSGVFDAVASNHVIYHVPADEQARAILELYRALQPGAKGLIAYTWPNCRFSDWILVDSQQRWLRLIRRILIRREKTSQSIGQNIPFLYFHPHSSKWVHNLLRSNGLPYEIRIAQLVDNVFSRAIIRNNLFGRFQLACLSVLEDLFPHRLAQSGRYPFIIIQGIDGKTINAAAAQVNQPFQYLKFLESGGRCAGPVSQPLVTIEPELEDQVLIYPEIRTSPAWSIEIYQQASLLWLGHGQEQGVQIKLESLKRRRIQVLFDVTPGPARSDSQRTLELTARNPSGVQIVRQQMDRSITLTFAIDLQPGCTEVEVQVLDEANISVQPDGESRSLLVLLRHIAVQDGNLAQ